MARTRTSRPGPVSFTVRLSADLSRDVDVKRALFAEKAGVSLSRNDFIIVALMHAMSAPIDKLLTPPGQAAVRRA